MAYQVVLSDEEYTALAKAATTRRQSVDALVHELVQEAVEAAAQQSPAPEQRALDPLVAYMHRMGHVRELPSGESDTPEIAAERERLAGSAEPGTLASEMVIEDRGPR